MVVFADMFGEQAWVVVVPLSATTRLRAAAPQPNATAMKAFTSHTLDDAGTISVRHTTGSDPSSSTCSCRACASYALDSMAIPSSLPEQLARRAVDRVPRFGAVQPDQLFVGVVYLVLVAMILEPLPRRRWQVGFN